MAMKLRASSSSSRCCRVGLNVSAPPSEGGLDAPYRALARAMLWSAARQTGAFWGESNEAI
jgi:hypothetical protein